MRLRAVVLAAGGSTRMGRPKALLPVGARTLVEAWVELLSTVAEVVVVDGAVPLGHLVPARTNPDWATTGPWESLRIGLHGHSGPALVTPVDVPPCSAEDLARLVAAHGDALLSHGDAPGHPVRLADSARLVGACPPGGLSSLLVGAEWLPTTDAGVAANMNTPADVGRWLG
ncbi:MAG: NTP transferase domain-containing protein [Proteobacteria bacterium]|nr:NTP transferase domain-containing protein [Pseudomonadota bacterium]MCP4915474.1 NTP transferase domain-containing protein [Pseudomonadota bacterium]